jgi:hypothetical protein
MADDKAAKCAPELRLSLILLRVSLLLRNYCYELFRARLPERYPALKISGPKVSAVLCNAVINTDAAHNPLLLRL